nr:hypothetical protein [uncultured Rhodoferax sp.]
MSQGIFAPWRIGGCANEFLVDTHRDLTDANSLSGGIEQTTRTTVSKQ